MDKVTRPLSRTTRLLLLSNNSFCWLSNRLKLLALKDSKIFSTWAQIYKTHKTKTCKLTKIMSSNFWMNRLTKTSKQTCFCSRWARASTKRRFSRIYKLISSNRWGSKWETNCATLPDTCSVRLTSARRKGCTRKQSSTLTTTSKINKSSSSSTVGPLTRLWWAVEMVIWTILKTLSVWQTLSDT